MSVNKNFEAYKIKREIKRSGISYEFKRSKVNDFGEPSDELEVIGTLQGLYHEESQHVAVTNNDTTQFRTKKVPNILCLYADAALLALQVGDVVLMNSKTFKVTETTNIQEWGIIADISLVVVDNGVDFQLQPEQPLPESGENDN